jgi:phosphoribosylformylglycinamidine synthase
VRLAVIHLSGSAPGEVPGAADIRVELVDAGAAELPVGVDAVLLLGDIAGERTREAGAAPSAPRIMAAVASFAAAGGPVLGVGGGFQALCAGALLPGALGPGPRPGAELCDLILRVEGQPTPFTQAVAAGRLLRLPGAPVPGCFRHGDPAALEQAGQIVLRYVDGEGSVTAAADPSGSTANVAGVCDERGVVVGVAAHPGDAAAALLGLVDGVLLVDSLRVFLEDREAAARAR